jgi:hypothetical protein
MFTYILPVLPTVTRLALLPLFGNVAVPAVVPGLGLVDTIGAYVVDVEDNLIFAPSTFAKYVTVVLSSGTPVTSDSVRGLPSTILEILPPITSIVSVPTVISE